MNTLGPQPAYAHLRWSLLRLISAIRSLHLSEVGILLLPNIVAHTPTEVPPAAPAATVTAADVLDDQLLTITS